MNSKSNLVANEAPNESSDILSSHWAPSLCPKISQLQEEWVKKIWKVLNTWEQNEWSENALLWKYTKYSTEWFKNVEKFIDFSYKIDSVSKNINWTSREIKLMDWNTHQVHKQTPELMTILPTPEKILEELFALEKDQFMKEWKLKKTEFIDFNTEQKIRIQQLLASKIIWLAGCINSLDIFHGQCKYGYLWTSKEGVNIVFNKDYVFIENSDTECSYSAVYSEK